MSEYVTFELAKKLKEKGFKEECLAYYTSEYTLYNNTICLTDDKYLCVSEIDYEEFLKSNNEETKLENVCDAPTISQVLKWLREQDIMVEIIPSLVDDGTWTFSFRIQTNKFYDRSTKDYDSYESSALACIEYILNDLI